MNRGRTGSSRAVTGLGSVCIGCVGLVAVACGDSFTTAPADGGSTRDAIATSDAGKPPWCASLNAVHTFCEDFSRGVPDVLMTVPANGGSIAADPNDYSYAPPSLLATTLRFTGTNATTSAVATKSFSTTGGSHFTLSLDLKIDSGCVPKGDQNPVSVLAIEFQELIYNYGVAIQVLPNEIDVAEIALTGPTLTGPAQLQVTPFRTTLPLTDWERWSLSINGAGTGANGVAKTVTLTVGTTTVFKQDLQKAPTFALQHPTIVVGAAVKNINDPSSPECMVHVDDILFDVHTL